ncbi:MAG: hypothetical protein WCY75_07860 [Sulfurimonadaceae bacterium]|nr:hypothetical protein [Candidatus Cloacimonadota bacterium]
MYKIILHLGLPKTATTSLQVNLLMKAHQKDKINFLGRHKSSIYSDYYNPFGNIISMLYDDYQYFYNFEFIESSFRLLLKKDLINVISEESLLLSHENKHLILIPRVSKLLNQYNCEVLISLREPMDFLFSYYVELYKWSFFNIEMNNTFQKFVNNLLKNSSNSEYDILFYDRILELVSKNFKTIKILLYEDLKISPECYIRNISDVFSLEYDWTKKLFFIEEQNKKNFNEKGRYSEEITLNQKLNSLVKFLISSRFGYIFKKLKFLKSYYFILLKVLSKIKIMKAKYHPALKIEDYNQVKVLLSKNNSFLTKKYGIQYEKFNSYGYVLNDKKVES